MAARDFAIYYDDGTVYDSHDGPFGEAPSDGVICVVYRHGDLTEFLSGHDYYARFADDGSIIGTGDIGPLLRGRCPWLKFGRYTSHANQARIMNRARDEWKGK
jgi:hypothetical protein